MLAGMAPIVRNIGDVRDTGQELTAVCHNPMCRAARVVDLELVIHHVGAAHPIIPTLGLVHFSERMRCAACGQRGMFIWIREPKMPSPWFGSPTNNQVNLWGTRGVLEQVVASTSRLEIGVAAFEAAVAQYPGRRVTLQEGAHLLRDSRLKVIKGKKFG